MIVSTTRQIQHIADLLAGRPTDFNPEHLTQPWRQYHDWVQNWIDHDPENVDHRNLRLDFTTCFAGLGGDERSQLDCRIISYAIEHPIIYHPASYTLANLPDLEWLWPEWIPLGMLSIFAASPGTGKSYISLDLAQRIIDGSQFPDGTDVHHSGPVLYVDAENVPIIFKQRLSVWREGQHRRLFYMQPDPDRIIINLDEEAERDRLLDHICVIRPILAIIDSYGSSTLRGDSSKEDVQELLAFLTTVANDHTLAILLVHHLRKRADGQDSFQPMTLDSIRGSSHIPAMARNILALQWIPSFEANGPRRMWIMKSNIAQYPDPLGVFFEPHPLNPDVALIKYGEPPEPNSEPTKSEQCEAWLIDLLSHAGEPMKPKDILDLGKEQGYNQRMIHRVRKNLDQICDTHTPRDPNNCWKWAADDAESEHNRVS